LLRDYLISVRVFDTVEITLEPFLGSHQKPVVVHGTLALFGFDQVAELLEFVDACGVPGKKHLHELTVGVPLSIPQYSEDLVAKDREFNRLLRRSLLHLAACFFVSC
jgi:hypothetical protein